MLWRAKNKLVKKISRSLDWVAPSQKFYHCRSQASVDWKLYQGKSKIIVLPATLSRLGSIRTNWGRFLAGAGSPFTGGGYRFSRHSSRYIVIESTNWRWSVVSCRAEWSMQARADIQLVDQLGSSASWKWRFPNLKTCWICIRNTCCQVGVGRCEWPTITYILCIVGAACSRLSLIVWHFASRFQLHHFCSSAYQYRLSVWPYVFFVLDPSNSRMESRKNFDKTCSYDKINVHDRLWKELAS